MFSNKKNHTQNPSVTRWLITPLLFLLCGVQARAQVQLESYGPYNAVFLTGGPGLQKRLLKDTSITSVDARWSLSLWFQQSTDAQDFLIAGLGSPADLDSRFLGLSAGRPILRFGKGNEVVAVSKLQPTGWHFLVGTFDDGVAHLYVDGRETASGSLILGRVTPLLEMAPVDLPSNEALSHFGGQLSHLELQARSLTAAEVAKAFQSRPDFSLDLVEDGSRSWPIQVRQQVGYTAPQDLSSMPQSRAPLQTGVAQPLPVPAPTLRSTGSGNWEIASNWKLAVATDIHASGRDLSQTRQDGASEKWLAATVPGTVLTTMVDRGVYPDPDFGLNNLAIPELLNKQDYWYRVQFASPSEAKNHKVSLTFNGINYAAEIWLNGSRVGDIKGAFIRGTFDVTQLLTARGSNVLAVRISPPPHPGIPEEESIKAGPGENGGAMCLDGPTFVASEGWDWIPSIRDRNTGIWQDVLLSISGDLRIGDPQVITRLPLPDANTADVEINVPIANTSSGPIAATLTAAFEGTEIKKQVTVPAGATTMKLSPSDYPQLHLDHPRLWWPNGYGKPELYHLKLTLASSSGDSDKRETSFGIREVTYELSLFDHEGKIRRVEVSPTEALSLGLNPVNVTHAGMRQTLDGWASTITPAAENSAAVKAIPNDADLTDLVIKVNGVRIAARGGNWGMDDSRKRVSREHLEPFFRLHHDANLNIIRNWVGQDTEETFYELADEYGLMVWNDFWASTQDYNAEPQDPDLFLRNARDVVSRFRNHPSIVIWCGRNEGVPQPILNEGLIAMLQEVDGTRYYTPSSNRVNLRNSGPYKYQDPTLYYTELDKGFSVELGISSFSTLESFQHSIAPADQWPISDAWTYHDWHQTGNGEVAPLMRKMEEQFGAATSLKDFDRKTQMFNYVDHRAIFEGFNQHLWTPNSGRMLWMTQPAWPSNMWQIFNSDYDTSASYYAVKKACEPVHVQLDLSNYEVAAVNTTRAATGMLHVSTKVFSLKNQLLFNRDQDINMQPNTATALYRLQLESLFVSNELLLVRIEARDQQGQLVSDNFYWLAAKEGNYRRLVGLGLADVVVKATREESVTDTVIRVHLKNQGDIPALEIKLTPKNSTTGDRLLPAYLSDNYISLLPGEERTILIHVQKDLHPDQVSLGLRGWNIAESKVGLSK
jgi:Exo-beta-D-glucosaminidase Ig-fold domain/Glycosyl hydrolases family 2/Concanavalin A-like lectin/glucanases superfamily/Glycosyl hydrolases family 2, sugar binding domain/Glycosyl hydrolases family 2, TIM barrel domain